MQMTTGWNGIAVSLRVLCAATLLLGGCGGGGGDTQATPQAQPAPPATVMAAADTPAAGIASIAEVRTITGSAAWGSGTLAVRAAGTSGEATVLALDSAGNIVLAARSDAATPELGAASTALVLVRAALGPLGDGQTSAQVHADIQGTADYAKLVEAVRGALGRGGTPSTAPEVLSLVLKVMSQAHGAIEARAQASATAERRRAMAIAEPRVSLPTPYMVLAAPLASGGVYVSETWQGLGTPKTVNGTLVQWAVRSSTLAGEPVKGDGTNAEGWQQLGASTFSGSQLDLLGRSSGSDLLAVWLQGQTVDLLKDGSGRNFELTVAQDSTTRLANLVSLIALVVKLDTSSVGTITDACAKALAEVLIDPEKLADALAAPTFDKAEDYLLSITQAEIKNTLLRHKSSAAVACGASFIDTTAEKLLTLTIPQLRVVAAVKKGLDAIGTALDMATLTGRSFALNYFWGKSYTVGVCQTASLLGGTTLANCTKELKFDRGTYVLAPGAVVQPIVSALDASGKPTGVAVDLAYSVDPTVDPVATFVGDRKQLVAAGDRVGAATLRVRDNSTDASAAASVLVTAARLKPASSVVAPGSGALLLELVDLVTGTQAVDHTGTGTTWRSSAPLVAALLGDGGSKNLASPLRPGRALIEVVNPNDPLGVMRAEILVRGKAGVAIVAVPATVPVGGMVRFAITAAPVPADPDVVRPTGNVTLRDSLGKALCSAALAADGSASCEGSIGGSPRNETITADYAGDAIFEPRADAGSLTLAIGLATPAATLTASPSQVVSGETASLAVMVTPGPVAQGLPSPTGSVTLRDSQGAALCVATLGTNGAGECTATFTGPTHSEAVKASYGGDGVYAAVADIASTSVQVLGKPPTAAEAFAAADTNDGGNAIRLVLRRGWDINGYIDDQRNLMLHLAAERCFTDNVRTLIELGSSRPINVWGDSPLYIAQVRCGGSHPATLLLGG